MHIFLFKLQIAISQLVFIPDPPKGHPYETAAARMCTDFNTDKCGTKQVDVAPEALRGTVTDGPTGGPDDEAPTFVPNQVSSFTRSLNSCSS